jgi:hypothetical protein
VGPWRRDHSEESAFAGASIEKPAWFLAFPPVESESTGGVATRAEDVLDLVLPASAVLVEVVQVRSVPLDVSDPHPDRMRSRARVVNWTTTQRRPPIGSVLREDFAFDIDLDVLLDIVAKDLPPLIPAVERLLG